MAIKDLHEKDIGKYVKYISSSGEDEIGRIKSWNDSMIFVVYKCNEEWDNYQNYTGCATRSEDLEFI